MTGEQIVTLALERLGIAEPYGEYEQRVVKAAKEILRSILTAREPYPDAVGDRVAEAIHGRLRRMLKGERDRVGYES